MTDKESSRISTFTESLIFSEEGKPMNFKITDFYQNSTDTQFDQKYLGEGDGGSFDNISLVSSSHSSKVRRFRQIEKYLSILKEQNNKMATDNQELIERSFTPRSVDGP